MLQKLPFSFLLILISCIELLGQDPSFINYDTKDGLPSSEVYDVEIDESGLLWFSTDRGVCSFDGYDFKNYTTSDGLADNTNFNIFKDKQNKLWFTGYSGNISIYENGQFSAYKYNEQLTGILGGYWIDYINASDDNTINLTRHFPLSKSVIKLSAESPPKEIDHHKLIEYNNHFTIKDKEVLRFGKEAITFGPKVPGKPSYVINSCRKYNDMWLHIVNNVIYKVNSNGEILQSFESNKKLADFYIDNSGHLWLFGPEGVHQFPDCDLESQPTTYFNGLEVTNLIQDFEGNFWLTTLRRGIIFVPSFDIHSIPLPAGTSSKFLSIGLLENNILFGSEFRDVLYCNKNHSCKKKILKNKYSPQIKYMNKFRSGLFFSGYEAKEKNEAVEFTISKYDNNFSLQLSNNDVICYTERGFSVYKNNSEIISSKGQNKTTKITQSKNDIVWIGTLTGLFFTKDTARYSDLAPFYMQNNQTFGRITDLYEENESNILWVATIGNGLHCVNTSTNNSYRIAKDRLNSDLINCLMVQNDSTLWVGTNNGVNIINFKFLKDSISVHNVISLTTNDGLISNFINDIEYWNNNIYLATNKGVCYFSPEIIEKSHDPVPIQINQLVVNDSIYAVTDSLVFDHDKNDFFIHFTGLNFRKNKEKDFYKYRLIRNGNKASWYYTNEKNIRYSNLTPANYLFEVSAQNNSSEWNEQPERLYFTIEPHFSQSKWFKLLSFLLIALALFFIYNSQIKRVSRREEANRKLEQAQLRIREAELSALRNQMNPHFVYNALNSIQNFIFKKDFEKANYYLVKFSRLMRSSLNFSRLDLITLKEEIDFLNDYIELEKMRFPDKFICNFLVEDDLPINSMMIPSLLLQPVLENVIKHAFKDITYTGKMDVNFSQNEKNQLKIIVEDNGSGLSSINNKSINTESAHKSLGLEIIKNRINLINESDANTESSMTFINKSDRDNTNLGLKVVFILPEKYNT